MGSVSGNENPNYFVTERKESAEELKLGHVYAQPDGGNKEPFYSAGSETYFKPALDGDGSFRDWQNRACQVTEVGYGGYFQRDKIVLPWEEFVRRGRPRTAKRTVTTTTTVQYLP